MAKKDTSKDVMPAVKKTGTAIYINGIPFLSTDKVKEIKLTWKGIEATGDKITELLASAVQRYFGTGDILYNAAINYRGKINIKIIADATGLDAHKVSTSIKIYTTFKDNPDMLKSLTLKDAVKFIAGPKENENGGRKSIAYGGDGSQPELDWEEAFMRKPLAKVTLEDYRIDAPNSHELWIVKRGLKFPTKMLEVTLGDETDAGMKLAYDEFMKKTQMAAEEYLSAKEHFQKSTGGAE